MTTATTPSEQSSPVFDLPLSSFTTLRNFTYHYIHVKPADKHKSTVLILHGFPSTPYDFHLQVEHLTSLGYGVVVPYLLGYFPTSTPLSPSAYRLKSIAADIVSLLDHLHLNNAPLPAIGHDWGVTLLSRLEYYHPDRISKLIYLTIGPTPVGAPFDLDKVNEMTRQFLGYEGYGYQKFFMEDTTVAAKLMEEKHDRMEMLMFAERSTEMWKEYFASLGGLEKWLTLNDVTETIKGVSGQLLQKRRSTFIADTDVESQNHEFGPGYAGPIMWYIGLNSNINVDDERQEKSDWETYKTLTPMLLVLSSKDPIALPDMQTSMAKACLSDPEKQFQIATLDAGHFVMLESSKELNDLLKGFTGEW